MREEHSRGFRIIQIYFIFYAPLEHQFEVIVYTGWAHPSIMFSYLKIIVKVNLFIIRQLWFLNDAYACKQGDASTQPSSEFNVCRKTEF